MALLHLVLHVRARAHALRSLHTSSSFSTAQTMQQWCGSFNQTHSQLPSLMCASQAVFAPPQVMHEGSGLAGKPLGPALCTAGVQGWGAQQGDRDTLTLSGQVWRRGGQCRCNQGSRCYGRLDGLLQLWLSQIHRLLLSVHLMEKLALQQCHGDTCTASTQCVAA